MKHIWTKFVDDKFTTNFVYSLPLAWIDVHKCFVRKIELIIAKSNEYQISPCDINSDKIVRTFLEQLFTVWRCPVKVIPQYCIAHPYCA